MKALKKDFFIQDTLTVARQLIGCYIVRLWQDSAIIGRLTETEAYIGKIDKACHAYNVPPTKPSRAKSMFLEGGSMYVYFIYGMHFCLNIVTEKEGEAAGVLLRSAEILPDSMETAALLRYNKNFAKLSKAETKNLANGPGKLCKALGINMAQNGLALGKESGIFITKSDQDLNSDIKASPRIGLGNCGEAKDFLWRFYVQS